jgi:hypothetical protein
MLLLNFVFPPNDKTLNDTYVYFFHDNCLLPKPSARNLFSNNLITPPLSSLIILEGLGYLISF